MHIWNRVLERCPHLLMSNWVLQWPSQWHFSILSGTWSVLATSPFGIWLNIIFICMACSSHTINIAHMCPSLFSLFNDLMHFCGSSSHFSMMIQHPNLVLASKLQDLRPICLMYFSTVKPHTSTWVITSFMPLTCCVLSTLLGNDSKIRSPKS